MEGSFISVKYTRTSRFNGRYVQKHQNPIYPHNNLTILHKRFWTLLVRYSENTKHTKQFCAFHTQKRAMSTKK